MTKGPGKRMMALMARQMIACDKASFLISMREERKLVFRELWQLKMHLLSCHLCRKYARQMEEMSHTMERYREGCRQPSCSHHLPPEAGTRIHSELERELNAN